MVVKVTQTKDTELLAEILQSDSMMVKIKKDLIGQKFGRLTVKRRVNDYVSPSGNRKSQWLCECNCEEHNQIVVTDGSLKSGRTQSCGCLHKETVKTRQKKYNAYDLSGEYGVGWTSNTNKEFYFDLEDYDKIKDYCWREAKSAPNYSYLVAWDIDKKKRIKMLNLLGGIHWDHKNRNPLDNRKTNLRPASASNNTYNSDMYSTNTSGIRGVNERKGTYRAYIGDARCGTYKVKYYHSMQLAILRRLTWELIYAGEFSPQIDLIKEQYPYLLGYFKVKDKMTFTNDMQTILDVGNKLKERAYCPCSLIENENTICPCIACRNKQFCHCGMFVPIIETKQND